MSRMLKRLAVCIAMVALGLADTTAATGTPAEPLTREVTLADLGNRSDDSVRGVRVTRDYTVYWPDAWEPQSGNAFTLQFSHSPALTARSSMTVEFNWTQITTIWLTPDNADNGSVQITLPEDLIRVGFNRLRLEFYMGLDDFDCQDLRNPAVWAKIHNTSAFRFSYTLKAPKPDLASFPVPFVDNSSLVENHVTFILPDYPSPAELNAAVAISTKLGQLAAWRTVHLHTLSETQAGDLEAVEGDIIVVGRVDRLHILRNAMLPFIWWEDHQPTIVNSRGEPLPPEAGVMWEQPSPMDKTTVTLIVTGATDDGVLIAARALASEPTYPHLTGQLGIVLNVPKPAPPDPAIGQVVTLEELGYAEQTAWGTGEQSIRYTIRLPLAWQIESEATLDLHFAHSAIIGAKGSSLNIVLNDTPVDSIPLTPENATEAHATFRLPAQLFQPGDNSLVVMSDMDFDDDAVDRPEHLRCLDSDLKGAWLSVYADSQLSLPGGPTDVALNLANYPPAFVGPAGLSDFAFIVPEFIDISLAHAVLLIAERLGHFVEGEALSPRVIDAQALASMSRPPGHQILIGRPTQNTAIADLNHGLPQPFKPATDDPEPVEALVQIVPPERAVGYVQAALSPEGQPRLVVTGTTDEGVLWASETLSDPDLLRELNGNLAIVRARGVIATAEVQPVGDRPSSPQTTEEPPGSAASNPGGAEEEQSEETRGAPETAGPEPFESIMPLPTTTAGEPSGEPRETPQPITVEQPMARPPQPASWIKWLGAGFFVFALAILGFMVWPEVHSRWTERGNHAA